MSIPIERSQRTATELGDDPVPIRLYARSIEGAGDVALLESHGINARLVGDSAADGLNYGLAVQKIELIVPRTEVEQANKILAESSTRSGLLNRTDWVCSGCGEINGREFDSCWSCNKVWSAADDEEYEPQTIAQPLPGPDDPVLYLPEQDSNPFAPPVEGTRVNVALNPATDAEIRRAMRSLVVSCLFPPLALYAFFVAANTLSRIGHNELTASTSQRWKLYAILLATMAVVPLSLVLFRLFPVGF